MRNKYYRATIQETGEEKTFDSKKEIRTWASAATMAHQCDITVSVIEIIEKEIQFNADYTTGEVEEVAA